MATYGDPKPKTSIGGQFSSQLKALSQHAKDEEQAILNQAAPRWYRPADWEEKSMFDIAAFHAPFLRTQQEDEFIKTVQDPDNAGTTGDLAMVVLQGDWLHTMERAFRARMFSSVRSRIQCGGRKMGHSAETGVIKAGLLGYVVNLDRLNKGERYL